jgi:hypothetical protein
MEAKPLKWQRQEIVADSSLYQEFDLTEIGKEDFAEFALRKGTLNAYCPKCQLPSVFSIEGPINFEEKSKQVPTDGIITIKAECPRSVESDYGKCGQKLYVCFYRDRDKMTKSVF